MPHIIIEYSENVVLKPCKKLLAELNALLPTLGPFDLKAIKSRVIEHAVFLVADQNDAAFIHVEVSILSGRDQQIKEHVSRRLLEFLQNHFQKALDQQALSLSVEIRDMPAACYSKFSTVL